MSILNRLVSLSSRWNDLESNPETQPVRMNLEERMALRREMVFEVVRDVMGTWGLPELSYRFKVTAVDRRGHAYVVMVDLPLQLMDTEQASQCELLRLGALIDGAARKRFNLQVHGVYWRVDERLKFEPSHHAAVRPDRPADSLPPGRSPGAVAADRARLAAIERSLAQKRPAQVDGRVYDTDLSPLAMQPIDRIGH